VTRHDPPACRRRTTHPDNGGVSFKATTLAARIRPAESPTFSDNSTELSGGSPRRFARAPNSRGGTWNRDGVIVFAPRSGSALYRVLASGGEPAHRASAVNPTDALRFE
jgi:hypothetical protein